MDVAAWLQGLGLERYVAAFRDNEIDWEAVPKLTVEDLKDLGVILGGHRRKLLAAIAALGTEAPAAAGTAASRVAPGLAETERRQLTVMFCDLVGSTELSARLDPEDLREIIAAYHRAVADVIRSFDGFVAKYMGDGVLVYFGYPRAHEDDAERAVRAGLGLIDAVARLDVKSVKLQARVGIATGLVVVGDLIGEGSAQEQSVIGETPNLAARLQTLAEPDAVVIAAGTRRLVGDLFAYHDLGAVEVKGIAGPVPAWQVLCPNVVASRFEALRGSVLSPLIGRDEEIDLLLRRWARAKTGDGQVVLVSGEPGIGKSRLTAALEERLHAEPHLRLRYFCSPYHQDSALFPFIDQLGRAAAFTSDDPPMMRLEKLEAMLARATPQDEDVALIADLLSLPISERNPLPILSPQRKKERTLEALLRELEGLTRQQPVMVIFEDAHWIDPTSRELLDLTVERVLSLPVLLIVTFRPEFQPPWTGQPQVTMLTLNRLDRRERAALATQIADGKAMPDEVIDQIVDRTDGVPLFVEELTKNILESGLLREDVDRYVLARALPPLAIPMTLHDSLMARLDRLASVRRVAQIGAAIGREFPYALLRAVSRLPEDELQASLDRLIASELVFQRGAPPNAIYTFKHALVQDAAHSSLLRSTRQQLHARIARVLEEQFPSFAEVHPQVLAQHFAEAGSLKEAVTYWCRAGRQSAAKSAVIEAIGQLRKGLQLVARIADNRDRNLLELELQVTLGGALRWAKGDAHPEVVGAFGRARDLLLETGGSGTIPHFSVQYGLWSADYIGGKPLGALHHANEFLSLAQSKAAAELASMGSRLVGTALITMGDYSRALSHLRQAASLYVPDKHQGADFRFGVDLLVTVLVAWAWALWHAGSPDRADGAALQALQRARQCGHPLTLVYALTHIGLIAVSGRRTTTVEELMREVITVSKEQEFRLFLAWALMLQGWTMAQRGQGKGAVDCIRNGLDMSRATGSRAQEPIFLGLLAEALALAKATEEGLAVLAEALAIAQSSGAKGNDAELHRLRGDLLGRLPSTTDHEVEACFRTALATGREQETRGFELRGAASLARLRRDQGRHTEARDLLAPVYGWFTEGFDTPDLKEAKSLLDELA